MRKKYLFAMIAILHLLPACFDIYRPLIVECNSIGIKKVQLNESDVKKYTSIYKFRELDYDFWRKRYDEISKKSKDIFGTTMAHWYCEVKFNNIDYYLVNYRSSTFFSDKDYTVDIIRKKDMKLITRLKSMKSVEFSALEITMNNVPFLFIFVGALASMNESCLFVVNSSFEIVYKEYLTLPTEIGYAASRIYGNCIVVRSRSRWRKTDQDDWQSINGDWVYYLPAN